MLRGGGRLSLGGNWEADIERRKGEFCLVNINISEIKNENDKNEQGEV